MKLTSEIAPFMLHIHFAQLRRVRRVPPYSHIVFPNPPIFPPIPRKKHVPAL